MKKSITMLFVILATLIMAISVAAEDVATVPEASPEPDAGTSYSESYEDKEHKDEPDCDPNCETQIPHNDPNDY